jgi:hypothetical protein
VGASAGLNLQLDQFAYEYDGRRDGKPASPVEIACGLYGPMVPPLELESTTIASRLGIDLAPVDITKDDACRWLEACIWPGDPARLRRLRAAIAMARRAPPAVRRGDARELLPQVLRELPPDVAPCIVTSWVLAYLQPDGRQTLGDIAASASSDRDVYWVTFEYAGVPPWLGEPPARTETPGCEGATLLSLCTWRDGQSTSTSLAWVQSHGRWMEWLDAASGTPRA